MEITIAQLKRCDLVTVVGRVDGNTAPDLERALRSITDDGRFHIVLDLGGTEFLSSAGLRALISTWKTARRLNRGDIVLANLSPKVDAVLDLAGLKSQFRIFPTTAEAVGSF
ncbi:MAG: STAS domain-containing protein [Anaerolineae bacterium]|nr:STAS domain-containing protein [Anaerolineae bacterium]